MKKIALCFMISYEHAVNKENIWLDWVMANSDIINVYFHYKDYDKIKSPWIKNHTIAKEYIAQTSYYHVVPAYINTMLYAYNHDINNQWFCMLTESCVPIISPEKFRRIFQKHCYNSILHWKKAWWNVHLHKRANLRFFEEEYRLGNDPWFVLAREDFIHCIMYINQNVQMYNCICNGGLANESLFAIVLHKVPHVKNEITHITDWDRMSSATSPYLFKTGDLQDITFIANMLKKNKFSFFLRKVDASFPDDILLNFIHAPDTESYTYIISVFLENNKLVLFTMCFMCVFGFFYMAGF